MKLLTTFLILFAAVSIQAQQAPEETTKQTAETSETTVREENPYKNKGKTEQTIQKKNKVNKSKYMEKFDTNKDGKLDESEKEALRTHMQEKHKAMAEKFDLNKDGKLDESEIKALKEARQKERAQMVKPTEKEKTAE